MNDDLELINDFVQEFYVSESYDLDIINKYMSEDYTYIYDNLNKEEKRIHNDYIRFFIEDIREKLDSKSFSITNKENAGYMLNYNGNGTPYFLMDKHNNKIIGLFILYKGDILSFAVDIYNTKKGEITPYYFFNKYGSIK